MIRHKVLEHGKAIALQVNLVKGKSLTDAVKIDPKEWDKTTAEAKEWLDEHDLEPENKVEIQIVGNDSIQETTFEDMKAVICRE